MFAVGKILKPQGIRGEVKVQSYLDTVECFLPIKKLYIKEAEFTVENMRLGGNFVVIKFVGLETMNDADLYKNCEIFIEKAPKLPEGRYYISDLLQCNLRVDGYEIGKLTDVLQYGSADVYEFKGEKNGMFPALNKVIKNIDIINKIIDLDGKEFDAVVVYED